MELPHHTSGAHNHCSVHSISNLHSQYPPPSDYSSDQAYYLMVLLALTKARNPSVNSRRHNPRKTTTQKKNTSSTTKNQPISTPQHNTVNHKYSKPQVSTEQHSNIKINLLQNTIAWTTHLHMEKTLPHMMKPPKQTTHHHTLKPQPTSTC